MFDIISKVRQLLRGTSATAELPAKNSARIRRGNKIFSAADSPGSRANSVRSMLMGEWNMTRLKTDHDYTKNLIMMKAGEDEWLVRVHANLTGYHDNYRMGMSSQTKYALRKAIRK